MSKIIDKNIKNGVVVVSTEGYFNKDLGEALKEITDQELKEGHKSFLINLDQSKIVNSIGASILIEIIEANHSPSFSLKIEILSSNSRRITFFK